MLSAHRMEFVSLVLVFVVFAVLLNDKRVESLTERSELFRWNSFCRFLRALFGFLFL